MTRATTSQHGATLGGKARPPWKRSLWSQALGHRRAGDPHAARLGYREVRRTALTFCNDNGDMLGAIRITRASEPNKRTLSDKHDRSFVLPSTDGGDMNRNSAVTVLGMLCWCACAACGKSGHSSAERSGKDAGASVRPRPSGVVHEPLEFACDSETAGSAATHAVFSESHGELLLVASDDSVLRIPIKVTRTDASKTAFDLRWNATGSNESGMPLVQTGTVDKLDGDRYSFEFSDLKDFVCKASTGDSSQFWQTLPSLGLPATKYIEAKTAISMTFAPDLQQTVLEQGGEALVFYYRVFSFKPELIRLAVLAEAPNDGKTILGRSVTMTKVGNDYLYKVHSDKGGPQFRLAPVK